MSTTASRLRPDLTFRYNVGKSRHGWLRLTPAYSVKLVAGVLESAKSDDDVLDPFGGTGTTGLVSAEQGRGSCLVEINPFLAWLARAKTRNYDSSTRDSALAATEEIVGGVLHSLLGSQWVPPIRNIDRWWNPEILRVLAAIWAEVEKREQRLGVAGDLLKVSFCRAMIECSNVAFNHQSMSFKGQSAQAKLIEPVETVVSAFKSWSHRICSEAASILSRHVEVVQGDSRRLDHILTRKFALVVTSPPYPNRISYIRELRPYMYWLRFLANARQSGEIDWAAIGGTWGSATSKLAGWTSRGYWRDHSAFNRIVGRIADQSPLLANYVHKYFEDMFEHFRSLQGVLAPGARAYYIIGNSKFYDVIVPTETLYEELMGMNGFRGVQVKTLRKRTSKKELYEFLVSGTFTG